MAASMPDPEDQVPEPEESGRTISIPDMGNKSTRIFVLAILGALVLCVALCSIPATVDKFQPEATPVPEPTWTPTPEPTWTPVPTVTPAPRMGLHPVYGVEHFTREYTDCVRRVVGKPKVAVPPTPTPTPDPELLTPEPVAAPSPMPTTELMDLINMSKHHSLPAFQASDRSISDHILEDIGGSVRWLLDTRSDTDDCNVINEYLIYDGRDGWLNKVSKWTIRTVPQ